MSRIIFMSNSVSKPSCYRPLRYITGSCKCSQSLTQFRVHLPSFFSWHQMRWTEPCELEPGLQSQEATAEGARCQCHHNTRPVCARDSKQVRCGCQVWSENKSYFPFITRFKLSKAGIDVNAEREIVLISVSIWNVAEMSAFIVHSLWVHDLTCQGMSYLKGCL